MQTRDGSIIGGMPAAEARSKGLDTALLPSIVVRDLKGRIRLWNPGAAAVYGWSTEEAVGKVSHALFQTQFPRPLEEINEHLLTTRYWQGELVHTRSDGRRMTVWSIWELQDDAEVGAPVVVETNKLLEKSSQQLQAPLSEALTSLTSVVENNLCHRCGTCVGVCPRPVFYFDEDSYPRIKDAAACTGCSACIKSCPGHSFDFEAASCSLFEKSYRPDHHYGHFRQAFLSFASNPDVRKRGTSGGFVTALLADLVEYGDLDAAVVVGSDPVVPWKGRVELAESADQVLRSAKSKYVVTPVNAALSEIRKKPGRYAVVALPCQIHGIRKAMAQHKVFRDRIVLVIGLFCHSSLEPAALRAVWHELGAASDSIAGFIYRKGKHAGVPWLVYRDGREASAFFPFAKRYQPDAARLLSVFYRIYSQKRCLMCIDGLAEFADIAVGDPWMPQLSDNIDFRDGYSVVMCRTQCGEAMTKKAASRGALKLLDIPCGMAEQANRIMATNKRHRAFAFMAVIKALGRPVPHYSITRPKLTPRGLLKRTLKTLSYAPCWLPFGRRHFVKVLMSRLGYALFYLNHRRRLLTGKEMPILMVGGIQNLLWESWQAASLLADIPL